MKESEGRSRLRQSIATLAEYRRQLELEVLAIELNQPRWSERFKSAELLMLVEDVNNEAEQ